MLYYPSFAQCPCVSSDNSYTKNVLHHVVHHQETPASSTSFYLDVTADEIPFFLSHQAIVLEVTA